MRRTAEIVAAVRTVSRRDMQFEKDAASIDQENAAHAEHDRRDAGEQQRQSDRKPEYGQPRVKPRSRILALRYAKKDCADNEDADREDQSNL